MLSALSDLTDRYAKIQINASKPIVPFRETIIEPPKVDVVNEAILDNKPTSENTILHTPNKQMSISIKALPLPKDVTNILENNQELLKVLTSSHDPDLPAISSLKAELQTAFSEAGKEWDGIMEQMWSVGPRKCGPNMLWNRIKGYDRGSIWEKLEVFNDPRFDFDGSLVNGFQLATLSGPMGEEPMMGVCFVIDGWVYDPSVCDTGVYGPLSGQVVSIVRDGCRKAFQAEPQRLMAAMYTCNILANAEILGKWKIIIDLLLQDRFVKRS